MNFLERLARALNMDEISHDIGVDLHTESLLLRAEQLSRLESEKLVDKVKSSTFSAAILGSVADFSFVPQKLLCCGYGTLPRLSCLRRERSFHDVPLRDVRNSSSSIRLISSSAYSLTQLRVFKKAL